MNATTYLNPYRAFMIGVLIAVLAACAMLSYFGSSHQRVAASGFRSVEVAFVETADGGIDLVPASCPSNAHNPNECAGPPSLSLSTVGSCPVGTPFTVNMTATDQSGGTITYSGTLDGGGAFSRGPVSSGSTQSVSWTFSSAGSHTVSVTATNSSGLSSSSSISFNCTEGTDGTGGTDDQTDDLGGPPGGQQSAQISANPTLVRAGDTSRVFWSSSGMRSCSVSGTNGDEWSGLNGDTAGVVTGSIPSRTLYTLTCNTGFGSRQFGPAVVDIIPNWREN